MSEIFKEELFGTIKKKRFIILTAILFVFEIVHIVVEKGLFFNDLIYFMSVQDTIVEFFTPFTGVILIISVYRKKHTRKSILQVKKHGQKRYAGVLARAASGSVILIAYYVIMALIVILLGVIIGAHNTPDQIRAILIRLMTDCLASIATYVAALFWLYLFAFPIVPVILFAALTLILPVYDSLVGYYSHIGNKIAVIVLPKATADVAYATLYLHNLEWRYVGIWILQVTVFLLLTMLVFKLKKLKPLKNPVKDFIDDLELAGDVPIDSE